MSEITPAEVSASLTAARALGGSQFYTEAARLTAAGAALPPQDKALYEQMARSRSLNNITAPEEAPATDTRSPAQIAHGQLHGIGSVDPRGYTFSEPPGFGAGFRAAERGQFNAEVRQSVADLGFSQATGSNFITSTMQTTLALDVMTPSQREAQAERWTADLRAQYGEKLPGIVAELDKLATDNPLLQKLASSGVLRDPTIFRAIVNRAAGLALHSSTRPTK